LSGVSRVLFSRRVVRSELAKESCGARVLHDNADSNLSMQTISTNCIERAR
jgi:hypothetical protein